MMKTRYELKQMDKHELILEVEKLQGAMAPSETFQPLDPYEWRVRYLGHFIKEFDHGQD